MLPPITIARLEVVRPIEVHRLEAAPHVLLHREVLRTVVPVRGPEAVVEPIEVLHHVAAVTGLREAAVPVLAEAAIEVPVVAREVRAAIGVQAGLHGAREVPEVQEVLHGVPVHHVPAGAEETKKIVEAT